MAVVINPAVEITGLSISGTTDELGTWNESIDLTATIPVTASAVLIYIEAGVTAFWFGVRDPDDPTARSGFQMDSVSGSTNVYICPVSAGRVDLYLENTGVKFWIAGYFESGAVEWFSAGNELTRDTTSAAPHTFDFSGDDATAKGAIFTHTAVQGDINPRLTIATAVSPTAYSLLIQEHTSAPSRMAHFVIPLNDSQEAFVNTTIAGTRTHHIVGFIKQDITFIYDDNSGPTENPTGTTYKAGVFDYGVEGGIGCMIAPFVAGFGFHAAADDSDFITVGSPQSQQCTAIMHTVKSSGGWNYILESGTPTYEVIWFMGPAPPTGGFLPASHSSQMVRVSQ